MLGHFLHPDFPLLHLPLLEWEVVVERVRLIVHLLHIDLVRTRPQLPRRYSLTTAALSEQDGGHLLRLR